MMTYSASHWLRVGEETRRMVAEVPLYRDRPAPPADPGALRAWLPCALTLASGDAVFARHQHLPIESVIAGIARPEALHAWR